MAKGDLIKNYNFIQDCAEKLLKFIPWIPINYEKEDINEERHQFITIGGLESSEFHKWEWNNGPELIKPGFDLFLDLDQFSSTDINLKLKVMAIPYCIEIDLKRYLHSTSNNWRYAMMNVRKSMPNPRQCQLYLFYSSKNYERENFIPYTQKCMDGIIDRIMTYSKIEYRPAVLFSEDLVAL